MKKKETVIEKKGLQFEKSQRLIDEAENLLGGPLLLYWNSENGTLTNDDASAFRSLLAGVPPAKLLYFCITSSGGSGLAALRIANLLRRRCEQLIVLVPSHAESAATMLALAADEIHLAPHANLSPVDSSIQHLLAPVNQTNDQVSVGQDELARIVGLWKKESRSDSSNPYPELWRYIHPLTIGAVDRANSLSLKLCNALMAFHLPDEGLRKRIAETLTMEYPTHGYPILLPEAREIGIPVKDMDQDVENILARLQECYVETGKLIRTDQDPDHHHDLEIPVFIERKDRMILCRLNRDWYYRTDEKRWQRLHSLDGWYIAELYKGKVVERPLNIQ